METDAVPRDPSLSKFRCSFMGGTLKMPGLSGEVGEIRIVGICPSRFNSFQTLYCKGRCIIREQSLGLLKMRHGKLGWESVDASRT